MPEKSKPAKVQAKTVKIAKPASGNQAVVTRKTKAAPSEGSPVLPLAERARLVAESAYYIAEARGFEPGNEQQDWLAAERQIDSTYRFA